MRTRSALLAALVLGVLTLPASAPGQTKFDPKKPKVDPKKKGTPKKSAPTWDLEGFVKEVSTKSPEDQVKAVTARLKELNSTLKDLTYARIENGAVTKVAIDTYFAEDISPLRAFPQMKELYAASSAYMGGKVWDVSWLSGRQLVALDLSGNTTLADVSALRGMPLKTLNLNYTGVESLAALEDSQTLEELRCSYSHVTNLKPLKGIKLKVLACAENKGEKGQTIADLAPLQGMMLKTLHLNRASATNFAVLKPMPIEELYLGDTPVADFSILKEMPLKSLELTRTKFTEKDGLLLKGKAVKDLWIGQTPIKDIHFVKDLPLERVSFRYCAQLRDLGPLKDKKITTLDVCGTAVKDLKPLAGMPLTYLECADTPVVNLEPLKGAPIYHLNLACSRKGGSGLADLKPLAGMPLQYLYITNTAVKDLKPLAGTPVHTLYCQGTRVTDLSVLKDAEKLYTLYCDYRLPKDASALKQIKSLRMINGQNAQNLLN